MNRKTRSLIALAAFLLSGSALAVDITGLPQALDAGWQGQKVCEVLYETDAVRVGRCVFPPGVGHEKHYHVPHFGYTIEGATMEVTTDEGTRVVTVAAGDNFSTSEITVHEGVNIGDTTAVYLIVEPKPGAAASGAP